MRSHNLVESHKIPDMELFSMSERASRDYAEFLKLAVVPGTKSVCDIKLREIYVLLCVNRASEPIGSSVVADILRYDPATITRSVVILVGKGLIRTSENYEDARSRLLNVTDEGAEFVNVYQKLLREKISEVEARDGVSMFHSDYENLVQQMHKIHERARFLSKAIPWLRRRQKRA